MDLISIGLAVGSFLLFWGFIKFCDNVIEERGVEK